MREKGVRINTSLKRGGTEVLTLVRCKRENVSEKVEGQKFWAWVHQVLRLRGSEAIV